MNEDLCMQVDLENRLSVLMIYHFRKLRFSRGRVVTDCRGDIVEIINGGVFRILDQRSRGNRSTDRL
jgi:hypothetical protein